MWALTKRMEKQLDGNNIRMLRAVLNKPWIQYSTKLLAVWPTTSYQKTSTLDKSDIRDISEEVRTKSQAMNSLGPHYTDGQRLDDQFEPINSSFVPIQDVSWKTYRERWTIETGSERSLLASWRCLSYSSAFDFDPNFNYQSFFILPILLALSRSPNIQDFTKGLSYSNV